MSVVRLSRRIIFTFINEILISKRQKFTFNLLYAIIIFQFFLCKISLEGIKISNIDKCQVMVVLSGGQNINITTASRRIDPSLSTTQLQMSTQMLHHDCSYRTNYYIRELIFDRHRISKHKL